MKTLFQSIRAWLILTVLTGILYPLFVTAVVQAVTAHSANGSLVYDTEGLRGSTLIGQSFRDPRNFWGRPSSVDYATIPSGATNLGPINPKLKERVDAAMVILGVSADASAKPYDLLLTSGSGLDPHIRPESAEFQIARVAQARGLSEANVRALVKQATEPPTFGALGRPRVNVLELNLALDKMAK